MDVKKTSVTVRLNPDELAVLEAIARESFSTRCNVLRRALHVLASMEDARRLKEKLGEEKHARP